MSPGAQLQRLTRACVFVGFEFEFPLFFEFNFKIGNGDSVATEAKDTYSDYSRVTTNRKKNPSSTMISLLSPKSKKKKRRSFDTPTAFEYVQQLDRKELQKHAKQHGIKANQKNDVLRQMILEVLTVKKSHEETKEDVTTGNVKEDRSEQKGDGARETMERKEETLSEHEENDKEEQNFLTSDTACYESQKSVETTENYYDVDDRIAQEESLEQVVTPVTQKERHDRVSTFTYVNETNGVQNASTMNLSNDTDRYGEIVFVGDIWECDKAEKISREPTIATTEQEKKKEKRKTTSNNVAPTSNETHDVHVKLEEEDEMNVSSKLVTESQYNLVSHEKEMVTTTEMYADENQPPSSQQHQPKKTLQSREIPPWKTASRDFRRARQAADLNQRPSQKQPRQLQQPRKTLQPREIPPWKTASRDFRRERKQATGPGTNKLESKSRPPTISKIPTIATKAQTSRALGERNMNDKRYSPSTIKNGKDCCPSKREGTNVSKPRPIETTIRSDVSKVIKMKHSPRNKPANDHVDTNNQPRLMTKTCRRPKAMAMSKRNEEQLQKFLKRQSKGRKEREQHLKNEEYVHLVRSLI